MKRMTAQHAVTILRFQVSTWMLLSLVSTFVILVFPTKALYRSTFLVVLVVPYSSTELASFPTNSQSSLRDGAAMPLRAALILISRSMYLRAPVWSNNGSLLSWHPAIRLVSIVVIVPGPTTN